MSKKDAAKNAAEEIINNKLSQRNAENAKAQALMTLGAISAFDYISRNSNAQTIRGLQHIRNEKLFEAFGFTRFDNFLNESPHSPMSYRQFNDRENLLEKEGDQIFDLLNNLKITSNQRKLLGAGNVQIDGETVIVRLEKNGEMISDEIPLDDRVRLLEALSTIADEKSELSSKTRRQKEIIERGETEVERLRKELDEAKIKPGQISIFDLYLNVTRTIDRLTEMVAVADLSERKHIGLYLIDIKKAVARLEGESSPESPRKSKNSSASADEQIADITSSLNDDELAELLEG